MMYFRSTLSRAKFLLQKQLQKALKEPYDSAKGLYIFAKKPYVSAKKTLHIRKSAL